MPGPATDQVIDLTNSPDPPVPPRRHHRSLPQRTHSRPRAEGAGGPEVIDVDELPDSPAREPPPGSSPEVIFEYSRPRPLLRRTAAPIEPRIDVGPGLGMIVHGAEEGRMNALPRHAGGHVLPHNRLDLLRRLRLQGVARGREGHAVPARMEAIIAQVENLARRPFVMPDLNYENPGFPMFPGEAAEPPPPPPPIYAAPGPANDGFTRSPMEDHIAICPNCDKELATGEEEEDRNVYVVKRCGHVG